MEKKAIIICIAFSILIFTLGPLFFQGGDYLFHYSKVKEGCDGEYFITNGTNVACENYTPLFHILAKPFSFSENSFFYFTIILFCIISPLIVAYYTKNWFSALLYFGASNYIFYFMDGIYPQALANILLFTLYFTKDKRIELGIIPLLILTHGSALIAGLCLILIKNVDEKGWFCSSVFLNNQPAALYQKVGNTGGIDFSINNILHLLTITFPFPYIFIAIKETWDYDKRYLFAIMFLLAMGYFQANRIWYLSFLFAIPAITSFYEKQDKRIKIFLVILTILFFLVNLFLFYRYHTECIG